MATQKQINDFISQIAPLVIKYAKQYGYKVASPIIAQACLESAYGTSSLSYKYHNYFGMKCGSSWKGKSVNLKTLEEYKVGTYTNITANFRVYDSMEEGIKGYFAFISTTRYANLKTAITPKQYLEFIKSDGYATSSQYVNNNMNVVTKHNLTEYDKGLQKETLKGTLSLIEKDNIKNLQCILNGLGYVGENNKSLTVDGIIGNNTLYALEKFSEWVSVTDRQ